MLQRVAVRRVCCRCVAVSSSGRMVVQGMAMAGPGRLWRMPMQRWPSPSARQRCLPKTPHNATKGTRHDPIKLAVPCAVSMVTGDRSGITGAAETGPVCRGTVVSPPRERASNGGDRPSTLTARADSSNTPPLAIRGGKGRQVRRRSRSGNESFFEAF